VLRVDGDSPEVEPRQQDDDRAKRAIDVRVTVEEVQVPMRAKPTDRYFAQAATHTDEPLSAPLAYVYV
jgi:hypothetical protein